MQGLRYNTPCRFRCAERVTFLASLPKAGLAAGAVVLVLALLTAVPFELPSWSSSGPFDGYHRPPISYDVPRKLNREEIRELVSSASREFRIREELLWAVITVESNFDAHAKSQVGALGLMQLMPETAGDLAVSNPMDPRDNIRGGARYLSQLLREFNGDWQKAIAAYNSGPANVRKHGGVPPFPETKNYVSKVMSAYQIEIARHTARSPFMM